MADAMESDGVAHIEVLHADGGATASALLMQLQADLLQRPVEVSRSPAASALGVARLVAQRLGVTPPAPATGAHVHPRTGDPAPARQAWARAVARSRGMTVPVLPTSTEAQIERNT